jgi:hypothetical protein
MQKYNMVHFVSHFKIIFLGISPKPVTGYIAKKG